MNQSYYNELSNIPTLTQEEQLALVLKAKAGDSNAFNQLIEGNLRLVVYHAKKYQSYLPEGSAITVDDLISEGNIGLIQAVKKYEPTHGTHLSYFAGVNIKRHIVDLLINNANTIRIPYRKFKTLTKISKTINQMLQTKGEVNPDDLEGMYTKTEIDFYFSRPQTIQLPDGYELPVEDEDENAAEMNEKLRMALKTLKPRERKIITEYYGIDTDKRKLTDIAKELGITKGGVSNIHIQVLNKLRDKTIYN